MSADLFTVDGGNGALFSPCWRYRYRLWRLWNPDLPVMVFILKNPSTAGATENDPTVRKCIGFAKKHGHGGIIIVNLFAWRSTDPRDLNRVGRASVIGAENDEHITWAFRSPILATVVAGWGRHEFKFMRDRATNVSILIRSSGRKITCLGMNQGGTPKHPLYVPYNARLVDLA